MEENTNNTDNIGTSTTCDSGKSIISAVVNSL